MSSAARVTRPTTPKTPVVEVFGRPVRRFTVREYHQLGKAGVFGQANRCELIHGLIVEKPVINPPHTKVSRRIDKRLAPLFDDQDWVVGFQQPITLSDSEPEPDFYAATGPEEKYDARHPRPKELVLVVEVSDSSRSIDHGEKLALYAASKIVQYWIIDVNARRIEVYTQPRGGKTPGYRTRAEYGPGDAVPVVVGGQQLGTIPVEELLP